MMVQAESSRGVLRLLIDCGGALDAENADAVKEDALALIDGSADVVVDLSRVELVDSRGIGALVGLQKAVLEAGRRANFTGVQTEVLRVMELIRLDQIFEVHPDVAAARRALTRTIHGRP